MEQDVFEVTGRDPRRLKRSHVLWLVLICVVLYGWSLVGGRPLTLHEARLPQTAREMAERGAWIVPTAGHEPWVRPWLERPPLPIWIEMGVGYVFGTHESVAVARIAPGVMGLAVVLMTAWMGARLFGSKIGFLGGATLATMVNHQRYSQLAEEDIFLSAVIVLCQLIFVKLELLGRGEERSVVESPGDGGGDDGARAGGSVGPGLAVRSVNPVGLRHWLVLVFFVVLGLTNLVKGVMFGTVLALVPVGGYLLWRLDWRRVLRYVWLPGLVLFAAVSLAWPVAIYMEFREGAVALWKYDLWGRLSGEYTAINEPWYYYLLKAPEVYAPWWPFMLIGLVLVLPRMLKERSSGFAYVVIWAVLPLVVLTVSSGKHHHYLVNSMAPWGMLTGFGLVWLRLKLKWSEKTGDRVFAGAMVVIVLVSIGLYTFVAPETDKTVPDTEFVKQVRQYERGGAPLFVNCDMGSMDFFRIFFYLDEDAKCLPETKYLQDRKITSPVIYVVSRRMHREKMAGFGKVTEVMASEYTRRERDDQDRFALYRLEFREDLERVDLPDEISPMRAMDRE